MEQVLYGQFDDVYEITSWVLVRDDVRYWYEPLEQAKHQLLRMSQCEEVRHLHCVGKGFAQGFENLMAAWRIIDVPGVTKPPFLMGLFVISKDTEHKRKKVGKAGRIDGFLTRQHSTVGFGELAGNQSVVDRRNQTIMADTLSTTKQLFDVIWKSGLGDEQVALDAREVNWLAV